MTPTASSVQQARELLLAACRATLAADGCIGELRAALGTAEAPEGLRTELLEVLGAYHTALFKMQQSLTHWRKFLELADRYSIDKGDEGA